MKRIDIILLKSDVFAEIASTTAYTGNKTVAADRSEFFERVATAGGDDEILSRYWREACAALADALRCFISAVTFGRETFSMTLEVSGSYDETLIPAAEQKILSIVATSVTMRWFRIAMPERAVEYEREMKLLFDSLLANLYYRKKPVKR